MNSFLNQTPCKKIQNIKEVKAILKSWQHRKLTLLGKITVIKTLALSKLIHLPNLPQTKIKDL
jgi:hypothetical protein